MGNSLASSAPTRTPEQEDLKFLGDRFPFGDAEFRHLYAAYQQFLALPQQSAAAAAASLEEQQPQCAAAGAAAAAAAEQQQPPRTTSSLFLVDWSVVCGGDGAVWQALNDDLLPRHFGNALYRAAFCGSTAAVDAEDDYYNNYHSNHPSAAASRADGRIHAQGPFGTLFSGFGGVHPAGFQGRTGSSVSHLSSLGPEGCCYPRRQSAYAAAAGGGSRVRPHLCRHGLPTRAGGGASASGFK